MTTTKRQVQKPENKSNCQPKKGTVSTGNKNGSVKNKKRAPPLTDPKKSKKRVHSPKPKRKKPIIPRKHFYLIALQKEKQLTVKQCEKASLRPFIFILKF